MLPFDENSEHIVDVIISLQSLLLLSKEPILVTTVILTMSGTWGEWFEGAKVKTKEFAEKAQVIAEAASKVAQEKAVELAKQANEMRQSYDMELASSIMTTISGPTNTNTNNKKGPAANQAPRKSVLDLVYVTENLVSMAFPYDPKKPGNAEGGNDINIVSKFLKQRHGSHFMIWNVSEEPYDYSLFGDQVYTN